MRLPRISIRSLMGYVVLVGVAIAALARPTDGWAVFLSTFALGMLPTSLLGVIYRRGVARAGWVGYAIFGWSFFLLLFFLHGDANSDFRFRVGWTLDSLRDALYALASLVDDVKKVEALLVEFGQVNSDSPNRVAYSLIGLMFALLGARIARAFARREGAGEV